MKRFLIGIFVSTFALTALGAADPVDAANLSWRTSCSVDSGAIKRQQRTWTFKTSKNKCPGGHFKQRAELSTAHQKLAANVRGSFMFETNLSLRSPSTQKFVFFQIHDGRLGCAPPLKVELTGQGHIVLESDYKTGPGERDCIHNRSISSGRSKVRIRRDGTEYKVNILVDFDGSGSFDVAVWVNDVAQISGQYRYPPDSGYYKSRFFFFKHGNYSEHMFDYQMTSRDMSMRRLRKR